MKAAKKTFFFCHQTICGELSRELSCIEWSLFHLSPLSPREHTIACCDVIGRHFPYKIAHICHDIDSTLTVPVDVPQAHVVDWCFPAFLACGQFGVWGHLPTKLVLSLLEFKNLHWGGCLAEWVAVLNLLFLGKEFKHQTLLETGYLEHIQSDLSMDCTGGLHWLLVCFKVLVFTF